MNDMRIPEFVDKYDVARDNVELYGHLISLSSDCVMMSEVWWIEGTFHSLERYGMYMLGKVNPALAEKVQKKLDLLASIKAAIDNVGKILSKDNTVFASIFTDSLENASLYILAPVPNPFMD